MSWLDEIQKKAAAITEFSEPEMPFDAAKQKIVGEMSDDSKRFFTLWRQTAGVARESFAKAARTGQDGKARKEAMIAFDRARVELETIKELFWTNLKYEHNLWEESCIGITQGFKVITEEQEGEPEQSMLEGSLVVHVVEMPLGATPAGLRGLFGR